MLKHVFYVPDKEWRHLTDIIENRRGEDVVLWKSEKNEGAVMFCEWLEWGTYY